jgi:CheY-like chemotaxis protein
MSELILVVDDEPKIVRLARDYLEKNGFRVTTAADGQSALTAARREKPDLIILDLMLPIMDGREVCKALRRESDVPIIMLTALAEEVDQVTGSKSARTITSPSRSHRVRWSQECAPCCAAPKAGSNCQASSAQADWRSTRKNIASHSMAAPSNSHPTNSNCCNCLRGGPGKPLPASSYLMTCMASPPVLTAVWTRTSKTCARNSKPHQAQT